MATLWPAAAQEIRWAGLSVAAYARLCGSPDGRWRGDACGCSDDRCVGFHHDEGEECGCLPVLLADAVSDRSGTL